MKRTVSALLAAVLLGFSAASCAKEETHDLLTYRYDYDLSQYIDLGDYKGLPLSVSESVSIEVTDEEVQEEIDVRTAYYSRNKEITNRGIQNYDTVRVACIVTTSEKISTTLADFDLTLGFQNFPAEVEEMLIGKKTGDTVSTEGTVTVTNYKLSDFLGQTCRFDITVKGIFRKEQPIYSEDFVRAYLGYDSIADLEASVKEELILGKKDAYYGEAISIVWPTIVESTTVKEYPKAEIEGMYNDMVSSNQAYAEMQGLTFTQYCQLNFQITEDEFYENARMLAESMVKEEMICYAIARAENITVSDEEYAVLAEEYVALYDFDSLEAFEAVYGKEEILEAIMFDKVHELAADSASMTYLDPLK
jgi:trigger factor